MVLISRRRISQGLYANGRIALVVAASAALHGLFLGMPWPFQRAETPAPTLQSIEDLSLMDVAIVPRGTLTAGEAAGADAAETDTDADLGSQTLAPEDAQFSEPVEPEPVQPEPAEPQPELESEPAQLEPKPESTSQPTVPENANPGDELPVDPGSTALTSPGPVTPGTLDERLRNPTEYLYDNDGVIADENGNVDSKESSKIMLEEHIRILSEQGLDEVTPKNTGPIQVPYLLNDCQANPPVHGLLSVTKDPEGNFLEDPQVVGSTGYHVLNEKAQEMAFDYDFPDPEGITFYLVQVEVLYPDKCLSP